MQTLFVQRFSVLHCPSFLSCKMVALVQGFYLYQIWNEHTEIEDLTGVLLKCRCRGSYMSAHVLLNLLNELGKRDKMRGLPSILSLFRNKFNKFKKTKAWMLDSIYHMTLRFFDISFLQLTSYNSAIIYVRCYGCHNVSQKCVNH